MSRLKIKMLVVDDGDREVVDDSQRRFITLEESVDLVCVREHFDRWASAIMTVFAGDLHPHVVRLRDPGVRFGSKIKAIKLVRSVTNASLREAKDAVERHDGQVLVLNDPETAHYMADSLKAVALGNVTVEPFNALTGSSDLLRVSDEGHAMLVNHMSRGVDHID